ncbi:sulfatase [Balneolales bacterium ANBcel1]|nr:sulfatase [Balneolales bacterium ANBcel1]
MYKLSITGFLSRIVFALMAWFMFVGSTVKEQMNILFISVDDLKPKLNVYGHDFIHSPHMDRLANTGILFTHAYCQQAISAPSRASLLTGLRPDSTRVYDLNTDVRETVPDVVTIPQYFKDHGYATRGWGKLQHYPGRGREHDLRTDGSGESYAWTEGWAKGGHKDYANQDNIDYMAMRERWAEEIGLKGLERYIFTRGPSVEVADVPDTSYSDGHMTMELIDALKEKSETGDPFFYAIGYIRPHLPFSAPREYWELYDRDELSLPGFMEMPEGAPDFAFQDSWELRNYPDIPERGEPIPMEKQLELLHGYYASVSFVDAQIGYILDALEETGLADNTAIVLFGDHGYHLGDHGMWCKHTNFEQANHSALIFRHPELFSGTVVSQPVELLDIFPTLVDFTGMDMPEMMQGQSFVPIMENPETEWKPYALSQYPRNIQGDPNGMGYSIRTERYRYTEWVVNPEWDGTNYAHPAPGNEVVARELYDYELDYDETRNFVDDPDYADVVEKMRNLMYKQAAP